MSGKGRKNQLRVLWGLLAVCLTTVGCQMQVSFLGNKDAQGTQLAAGQRNEQDVAQAPANSGDGVAQAAYTTTEQRPDKGKPAAQAAGQQLPPPVKVEQGVAAPCLPPGLPDEPPPPVELRKISLPPYVIEPPDILLIDAVRLTPMGPYKLEPGDVLQIQVADTLPNQPIVGPYPVSLEGTINLGFSYGVVKVAGLSAD